jgi:hypothetical protein
MKFAICTAVLLLLFGISALAYDVQEKGQEEHKQEARPTQEHAKPAPQQRRAKPRWAESRPFATLAILAFGSNARSKGFTEGGFHVVREDRSTDRTALFPVCRNEVRRQLRFRHAPFSDTESQNGSRQFGIRA